MSFFEGYIVARSLSRGRYRPATAMQAGLLYPGAGFTGIGLAMLLNGHQMGAVLLFGGIVLVIGGMIAGSTTYDDKGRPRRRGFMD
jgi:hypothetical protein